MVGAVSPEAKWLEHEADETPPSNAKFKDKRSCTFRFPLYYHLMYRDSFDFYIKWPLIKICEQLFLM
jgi:hypothetical protein